MMGRLVLVDAEALEEVRAHYERMARVALFPEVEAHLSGVHERLTPVAPELPEGWQIAEVGPRAIAVRSRATMARVWAVDGGLFSDGEPGKMPLDVAAYLIARQPRDAPKGRPAVAARRP